MIMLATALLLSLGSVAQNIETLDVANKPNGHFSTTINNFIVEGEVLNGLKEGNWYEIYVDKQLIHRMIQYHNGMKEGVCLEVDETGALLMKSEYVNDQLNGATYSWYRGGRLSHKNTYKDGVLDGEQIECYEQGTNREISQYKAGLRDGLTTWFDQNGNKVMSIEYRKGLFEGEQKTFFKSGQVKSLKLYKDNVQDGPAFEYYESGSLKSEATYKKGKLSGKEKTYEDKAQVGGKEVKIKLDADQEEKDNTSKKAKRD